MDYNRWCLVDTPAPSLSGVARQQPKDVSGACHAGHPPTTPWQLAHATLPKLAAEGGLAKCIATGRFHQSPSPPLGDHWFEDRQGCIYLQAYVCNNGTKL